MFNNCDFHQFLYLISFYKVSFFDTHFFRDFTFNCYLCLQIHYFRFLAVAVINNIHSFFNYSINTEWNFCSLYNYFFMGNINWFFSFDNIWTRFLNNLINGFFIIYWNSSRDFDYFGIFNFIFDNLWSLDLDAFNFFFYHFIRDISITNLSLMNIAFLFERLDHFLKLFCRNIL